MNKQLYKTVNEGATRSHWGKGVKAYALELVENAEVELTLDNALKELLNGAESWFEYSYSGNACVYDGDIVEMLCTPSEIKRFEDGKLNKPNARETWLDIQARALTQAYRLIKRNLK